MRISDWSSDLCSSDLRNNATDGNTTGYGSTRSLFIDSNSGSNCPVHVSFNNNALGFLGAYGIQIGDGFAHVRYHTFVKPHGPSAGSCPPLRLILGVGARGTGIGTESVRERGCPAGDSQW